MRQRSENLIERLTVGGEMPKRHTHSILKKFNGERRSSGRRGTSYKYPGELQLYLGGYFLEESFMHDSIYYFASILLNSFRCFRLPRVRVRIPVGACLHVQSTCTWSRRTRCTKARASTHRTCAPLQKREEPNGSKRRQKFAQLSKERQQERWEENKTK